MCVLQSHQRILSWNVSTWQQGTKHSQALSTSYNLATCNICTCFRWPNRHAVILSIHFAVFDFEIEFGVEGNALLLHLVPQVIVLALPVVAQVTAWVPFLLVGRIFLGTPLR